MTHFFFKKMESIFKKVDEFFYGNSFVLVDLKQKGNKGNYILEVFVDKKENFGIDELAEINRNLWKHLESEDMHKGIMKIIVSSPGTENPVKYFWQLEKHIGREVELKLKTGDVVSGKLVNLTDMAKEELQIEIKEKKEIKLLKFLFGELSELKIKLSFKK